MIESRNILISLCQTVEDLQRIGICTDGFSIFVRKSSGAAHLQRLRLSSLVELVVRLNLSTTAFLWVVCDRSLDLPRFFGDRSFTESAYTERFLDVDWLERLESHASLDEIVGFWVTLARTLDLGLISYCGAHLVSAPEHFSALHLHSPNQAIRIAQSSFE